MNSGTCTIGALHILILMSDNLLRSRYFPQYAHKQHYIKIKRFVIHAIFACRPLSETCLTNVVVVLSFARILKVLERRNDVQLLIHLIMANISFP